MYGSYYLVVKEWYWRWILFLLSNPVFEVPTILFIYYMHHRNFSVGSKHEETFDQTVDQSFSK